MCGAGFTKLPDEKIACNTKNNNQQQNDSKSDIFHAFSVSYKSMKSRSGIFNYVLDKGSVIFLKFPIAFSFFWCNIGVTQQAWAKDGSAENTPVS